MYNAIPPRIIPTPGSKSKDENVEVVAFPHNLPYAYIPFDTYLSARAKHPTAKLYIYEGRGPVGFKIVALPVHMTKPVEIEEGADEPHSESV